MGTGAGGGGGAAPARKVTGGQEQAGGRWATGLPPAGMHMQMVLHPSSEPLARSPSTSGVLSDTPPFTPLHSHPSTSGVLRDYRTHRLTFPRDTSRAAFAGSLSIYALGAAVDQPATPPPPASPTPPTPQHHSPAPYSPQPYSPGRVQLGAMGLCDMASCANAGGGAGGSLTLSAAKGGGDQGGDPLWEPGGAFDAAFGPNWGTSALGRRAAAGGGGVGGGGAGRGGGGTGSGGTGSIASCVASAASGTRTACSVGQGSAANAAGGERKPNRFQAALRRHQPVCDAQLRGQLSTLARPPQGLTRGANPRPARPPPVRRHAEQPQPGRRPDPAKGRTSGPRPASEPQAHRSPPILQHDARHRD